MKRICMGLAAALALVGCGNEPDGGGGLPGSTGTEGRVFAIASQVGQVLGGIGSGASEAAPRVDQSNFAPDAIAADPQAYRLVQINALGLQEAAQVIRQNGDEVTIALQSGPTAAYDDGVLVATRGFGDDLFTVDSRGVREALRAGGGTVTRRMEMLSDQDQILTTSFACTIELAGRETLNLGLREASLQRFNENCRSEALIFDNIYWLDEAGSIVASRQYVSPTIAYLRANAL